MAVKNIARTPHLKQSQRQPWEPELEYLTLISYKIYLTRLNSINVREKPAEISFMLKVAHGLPRKLKDTGSNPRCSPRRSTENGNLGRSGSGLCGISVQGYSLGQVSLLGFIPI